MRLLKQKSNPWAPAVIIRNLVAGFTVAVVALPLALAIGIGSGLGGRVSRGS